MKNPQTTIALPFLTHNISAIGDVMLILVEKFKFSRYYSTKSLKEILKI